MNNIRVMQSIEIHMHVQNYVLRNIYEQTGIFWEAESDEEEDKIVNAAIVGIVPDEITRFLMNLAKLPAIEERN